MSIDGYAARVLKARPEAHLLSLARARHGPMVTRPGLAQPDA
jgi:hypothetical protein